jgi:hypothetical protein
MAQTKKRRNRKHRGTQGGSISRRPKGRPKTRAEARSRARSRPQSGQAPHRADTAPTWRGAWTRGAIAAGVFFLLMLIGFGRTPLQSASLGLFMLAIYVPLGYFFDLFMHRRRQRQKQREREQKAEEK